MTERVGSQIGDQIPCFSGKKSIESEEDLTELVAQYVADCRDPWSGDPPPPHKEAAMVSSPALLQVQCCHVDRSKENQDIKLTP